jgi:hypothetical protein
MTDLFWSEGKGTPITPEDLREYRSFERVAARIINLFRAWTCRALTELPVDAREWVLKGKTLDLESPGWVDFSNPDLVLGDLLSIHSCLPTCQPEWVALKPDQQIAFNILCEIRVVIEDLKALGVTVESLRLLEKSLGLGIESAKGHVKPYERYASVALKNTNNLINQNFGTPDDSANGRRLRKGLSNGEIWYQEFLRLKKAKPGLTARSAEQIILKNPEMPHAKPGTIRKKIREFEKK